MADPDWLAPVIRRLKKGPLVPHGSGTPVSIGRADIERLLPHRAQMLLLDAVDVVDLGQRAVRGRREIRISDLGFEGHFPNDPIYPGVLLIEAIGQLGLTLLHFAAADATSVPATATPPRVRATHIHHAAFLAPVVPGDELVLYAQVVDDGLTTIAAGQAYKNGAPVAYAVSEVYVDA